MQNKKPSASAQIAEIAICAMLGSIMFCSKIIMELFPNIHLIGVLTIAYTVVFRAKALIPIYVYVMLNGLFAAFSPWWVPYLYIWTVLWGATMLLPRHLPKKLAAVVYPVLCMLHGLLFGVLYAPAQAIMFDLTLEQTIAWIIAGLPFDLLHTIGNLALGLLVLPIVKTLTKLKRQLR